MLQKETAKKTNGMLFIWAICFSFLFQMAYFHTDYGKIISNKSTTTASIQELKDINQNGNIYTPNSDNSAFLFAPPAEEITGILFRFNENRTDNILYNFSYGQNGGEPNFKDMIFDSLRLDSESFFIPLEKGLYTTLKLELLYGIDVNFNINEILFVQEEISLVDQLFSRISITHCLISLLVLGLLTVFFRKLPDNAKIYLPYLLVAVSFSILFANQPHKGDDISMFYGHIFSNSPLDIAILRYNTWSSRQIIEFFLYYWIHIQWLWALITGFLIVLYFWSVNQVLPKTTEKTHLFLATVFLIFPLTDHGSAGWMATTTNYLWPMCFLSFSLVLLKKFFKNEKITPLFYTMTLLASLYAVNQEQSSALYFGAFVLAVAYAHWKKIKATALYPQVCLGLFSLIYHLTCPGNQARAIQHEYRYFPGFSEFSSFVKFDIGLSSSLYLFLFSYNTMFFTLCALLLALAYGKKDKKLYIFTGIPLAVFTLNNIPVVQDLAPFISTTRNTMSRTGLNLSFSNPDSIISLLLLLATFASLLLAVYFAFQDKTVALINVVLIFAGFCSRVILGFSPTVWISGTRTMLFFYYSVMISATFLYVEMERIAAPKRTFQLVHLLVRFFAVSNLLYFFYNLWLSNLYNP